MADAADSKSVASDGMWVRLPPPAPNIHPNRFLHFEKWFGFCFLALHSFCAGKQWRCILKKSHVLNQTSRSLEKDACVSFHAFNLVSYAQDRMTHNIAKAGCVEMRQWRIVQDRRFWNGNQGAMTCFGSFRKTSLA